MRISGLAFRNLRRRFPRSSLTTIGIASAVAAFVALVGLSRGIELSLSNLYMERGAQLVAVRARTVEILTATIDETVGEELRRAPGVADVAAELYDVVELDTGGNLVVSGWPAGSFLWKTITVYIGHAPTDADRNGVLLGEATAQALGVSVGDSILIGNHSFHVTGLTRSTSALAGRLAAVPLKTLQRLLGRPGKVTLFNLRLEPPYDNASLTSITKSLAASFPGLRFLPAGDLGRDLGVMRLLHGMVWAVTLVALLMAALLVVNTLLMSVAERRHEIGVLVALGWSRTRIMSLIVGEGIALGLIGGALGLLMGIGAFRGLAHLPQLRGFLATSPDPRSFGEAVVAILLLGIVGGAWPAWRAAQANAADAIKGR